MEKARPLADRELKLAGRLHSAAIHLLRNLRRADIQTGLSAPRLSALSVVVFRGPLPIGELASAEQIRPPSATRLASDLERLGLIRYQPDKRDRRVVQLRATPKGRRILRQGRSRRIQMLAERLAALPASDKGLLEQAASILERVVAPNDAHS